MKKVTVEGIERMFMKEHVKEGDDMRTINAKRVGFYSVLIPDLVRSLYSDNNMLIDLLYGEECADND